MAIAGVPTHRPGGAPRPELKPPHYHGGPARWGEHGRGAGTRETWEGCQRMRPLPENPFCEYWRHLLWHLVALDEGHNEGRLARGLWELGCIAGREDQEGNCARSEW
ncbi:hypothetical protein KM043_014277 [Ampulex compressa]|nr:hypothetical protein KM043_014277 [Ampulex compressa]